MRVVLAAKGAGFTLLGTSHPYLQFFSSDAHIPFLLLLFFHSFSFLLNASYSFFLLLSYDAIFPLSSDALLPFL
jgi:hypothetical protein